MIKGVITILILLLAEVQTSPAQVAVIVHKAAPVDTLTQAELFDYFSCEVKTWSNKTPVVVFDLKPQSEIKEAFYEFLGKSASRMKSIWMKKLLMGEGDPPQALLSEEEVLKKVAATPGAIGFVSKARVHDGVKVVLTIVRNEK